MYAKLVVGSTGINAILAMRDIVRLCTSSTPTTALLGAFSTSSSVIIDSNPAGWTYVGSNNSADRPTVAAIGATGFPASGSQCNLVISAPCLETAALKYVALSISSLQAHNATHNLFTMTGAVSATSLGVLTNEGPRYFSPSGNGQNDTLTVALRVAANDIVHVIATPRGITIVNEARGMQAVWEMSMSDVNRFYNTAPFVQYCHATSSNFTSETIIIPTSTASVLTRTMMSAVFGVTDVNTGTFYGTYSPGNIVSNLPTLNIGSLFQTANNLRLNSIDSIGSPRYQVTPVFLQIGALGHPIQSVTGTTDIYWTRPNAGFTGDTMLISGDTYTFFNCGTGYGIALKTS